MSTTPSSSNTGLSKERLDEIVECLKNAIADDEMRQLSQRAVQAKVWHLQPKVAAYMADLRQAEEQVRINILKRISSLVYRFHEHTLDVTLARAGVIRDSRVHRGSLLEERKELDVFCLDAKERLYLILKQYDWFADFFRLYPQHFYENSFAFVDNIPDKKLKVKVKVVGLGIAGSMTLSGLARAGVDNAVGYEKRDRDGSRSVTSRYQNASWRAYNVAEKLLDAEAFQHLMAYRQRLNVTLDDGSTKIVTSDRVQIILGDAIDASLKSAERCGATIKFGAPLEEFYGSTPGDDVDIVALFAGAHTAGLFPGMEEAMRFFSWPDLSSTCRMWLRINESEHKEPYTTRGGEIGAEKWHYTIASARNTIQDIQRVKTNVTNQYKNALQKQGDTSEEEKKEVATEYESKLEQLDSVLKTMEENSGSDTRFDYVFTNAPQNDHNLAKRLVAGEDGAVVIDGGYTVDIKIASHSKIGGAEASDTAKRLLEGFSAKLIVTGGDACVPPNPLAAYGATLACEAADMVVQLAVAYGHLNSILKDLENMMPSTEVMNESWIADVHELKDLLAEFYNARGRSENFFQFVQTLICNLYSLPPMAS